MHSIEELREKFLNALEVSADYSNPDTLYDPIKYILQLGGKRIRPISALAACEMFGRSYKEALNQALAIEIFHNFTLMHDDIMDSAPLRRGKPTVHEKWDHNTAILSGDAMFVLCYHYLVKGSAGDMEVMKHFNHTAMQVCEGQQYDMDFEKETEVSMAQYIDMIRKKTAVLLGEALRLGAIAGGAGVEDAHLIYDFGTNFGIAFQLQDDLLDAFGDPEKFGKQVGGDIIEGKKTFLYLKALEVASEPQRDELISLYQDQKISPEEKVKQVLALFTKLNVKDLTRGEMNRFYLSAGIALNSIEVPEARKKVLKTLAERSMVREI